MSYSLKKIAPDRYLVWDLLRESDPYYLNQHFFDADLSRVAADREQRKSEGQPAPSFVAYALAAYGRTLADYPVLNSYLRVYPFTRLAVYDGVDISLTIERDWNGNRIILLGLLREAQSLSLTDIHRYICEKRDKPLEELEEFSRYTLLLKTPAFCRWHLFQIFCKPFPGVMRTIVGTTAFTSIGKYGSTMTAPISPRTCTLSLGHVEQRPRIINGEVRSALSAWLTLTYDHRICDGALVAKMGNDLRERLENWPKGQE